MPENSNEILIPEHLESNGGIEYKIGENLKLDVSKRLIDGEELNQNNPFILEENSEYLEKIYSKEYKVVGKIERPNFEIEEYSAPGYTIITKMDEINDGANVVVKFNNIKDTYKLSEEIAENEENPLDIYKYYYRTNSELLRWSGVAKDSTTVEMLYSLVAIVIGIIIISSVFVIKNSFSISITEKLKQYGMFASIGATKKQIKNNVLYEGFLLGIISIPLGILSGIFAAFILINITSILIGNDIFEKGIKFVFDMPFEAMVLSVILSIITIYLSCIFSARKASKISPIEAIRSNEDIKIKSRKIKTSKVITKIFGIGGEIAYKNLKRNKKKYRTTVISLVLSITIFISLSSFLNYVFKMSGMYYQELPYNVGIYINYDSQQDEEYKDIYNKYLEFLNLQGIKNYYLPRYIYVKTDLVEKAENSENSSGISIMSLGEETYKKYLKTIGEDYENCKDKIIIINPKTKENDNRLTLKEGDKIIGDLEDNRKIEIPIAKITDKMFESNSMISSDEPFYIVSDEFMNKYEENYSIGVMELNAEDSYKICGYIEENYKDILCMNYQKDIDQIKRVALLISIFLYGFITVITLIGVTNIFNTITTNMNLRSKEFAMLKSIGMTKKEFNKMINLESIFYGIKSLMIGIILGLGLSYLIYRTIISSNTFNILEMELPIEAIIISVIFIMIVVGIIMRYSLNKINKQNIIETIRKDNI